MNVELMDLWLPIVLSGVICFIASAVMWMALPHHKADIKPLPDEARAMDALTPLGLPPGLYMYPNCQGEEKMNSEAYKARWAAGPWGTINILAGQPQFARNLGATFLEMLVVALIAGYLASIAVPAGAEYMAVFRFVGTAGVLGFVMGGFATDAFLGKPGRFQLTSALDGIVYALLMAGTFAWLWPDAAGSIGPGGLPTP
jgi:hypothetical protein